MTRIGAPSEPAKRFRDPGYISDLIHQIGHEIGNPLTSIISIGSVLETLCSMSNLDQDKTRQYCLSIVDEAWRVSRLSQQTVLMLSDRPGVPEHCDVESTIQKVLSRLQSRYGDRFKTLELECSAADNAPTIVAIDRGQFEAAISEIMFNVVEATERDRVKPDQEALGCPKLTVNLSSNSAEQLQIEFSSLCREPTNIELADLFCPHGSVDIENKRIGLGLCVVQSVVERVSGAVHVCEKPAANGFEFSTIIRLPRELASHEQS